MLPQVELACNSAVAVSTGYAPSEMVFGAPVCLPIDIMTNTDDVRNKSGLEVASRVAQLVDAARGQIAKAQEW